MNLAIDAKKMMLLEQRLTDKQNITVFSSRLLLF